MTPDPTIESPTLPAATVVVGTVPPKRVGAWPRLGAALIDWAVLLTLIYGGYALLVAFWDRGLIGEVLFIATMVATQLAALAYTSFEVLQAATPGKMLLRLRIMCADGTPADGWRLFLRWSTKQSPLILTVLSYIPPFATLEVLAGICSWVVAIGCLWVLSESRMAWHDTWAGTAVFKRDPARARGFQPVVPDAGERSRVEG